MRMDDIRYFIQVAQCGSLNRAAKRCFITQQGLSRIIANMEKELNVTLFQRNGKKLQLTPTGAIVLRGLLEVDGAYNAMLDSISGVIALGQENKISYTIYATPVICVTCLPHILSAVSREFPSVNLLVTEKSPLEIFEEIEYNENAIGLASGPAFLQKRSKRLTSGQILFEKCYSDVLRCCVHESNPIADKSIILNEELSRLPLVCHNTEILMAEHILGRQLNPSLLTNTTNHSLCRAIVNSGSAVGMTSAIIEQYEADSNCIVTVPMENSIRIDYGYVYAPGFIPNEIGQSVIQALKKELSLIAPL